MIVVAVANSKGGTGKTTIASALAVRAAQDSARVAMVDMDPQKSLIEWWKRRGQSDNPCIFEGAVTVPDALEALQRDGWDWVFLDGPPAFLSVVQEMIEHATFTLIPVKPSMVDLLATQDAVVLARQAGAAFACVFNDINPRERIAAKARELLLNNNVPITTAEVAHRVAHIAGMTLGRTAAESKDKAAAQEIDALWKEVKAAALRAASPMHKRAAHG